MPFSSSSASVDLARQAELETAWADVKPSLPPEAEVELTRFRGLFTAIAGQVSSLCSLPYLMGER